MEQIKSYMDELNNGTKIMFKEFFNKDTNKKQRANMWTFSRLVTSFLIPIFLLISKLLGSMIMFPLALITTMYGAMTDFLDGRSARKYHSTSKYGATLDSITDKVFSGMIGISLALFNPLFLINIASEAIITLVNVYYKIKYNNNIGTSKIGKIKQWPLSLSLVLGFMSVIAPTLTPITNTLIGLTTIMQIATIIDYQKINRASITSIKEEQVLPNYHVEIENNEEKITKNYRLEEYIKLRNVLNEIIKLNNNQTIDKEKRLTRTK